jgi:hypothetical protein
MNDDMSTTAGRARAAEDRAQAEGERPTMKIVVLIDGREYVPKIQLDQCLALLAGYTQALDNVRKCAIREVEALKSMANFPTVEAEPG